MEFAEKAYKIPEGKSYKLSCEGVRVVVYDKDLNFKHDSLEAGPVESVGEGYIVVCSGESGVLKVTDYHKEGENDNQG